MPEFNFKSPVVTRKVRETEIILKENDETKNICSFIHLHRYIKELEMNNIIRRTTKQKEIGIMLDADGRVILDKSINYGKQ